MWILFQLTRNGWFYWSLNRLGKAAFHPAKWGQLRKKIRILSCLLIGKEKYWGLILKFDTLTIQNMTVLSSYSHLNFNLKASRTVKWMKSIYHFPFFFLFVLIFCPEMFSQTHRRHGILKFSVTLALPNQLSDLGIN